MCVCVCVSLSLSLCLSSRDFSRTTSYRRSKRQGALMKKKKKKKKSSHFGCGVPIEVTRKKPGTGKLVWRTTCVVP